MTFPPAAARPSAFLWSRHLAGTVLKRHSEIARLCECGAFPGATYHAAVAEWLIPIGAVQEWQARRRADLAAAPAGEEVPS